MTCLEMIENCERSFHDQLLRADGLPEKFDERAWNLAPSGGWSPAQIFEHLVLSNEPYLDIFDRALSAARDGGEAPVKQSFLGKMILKAAGPAGNAPAPKAFVPGPGPFGREVYVRWRAQQERLIAFCAAAKSKDLGSARVRNPLLKWVRMTLCDCFLIMADHTERHIRQIEEKAQNS